MVELHARGETKGSNTIYLDVKPGTGYAFFKSTVLPKAQRNVKGGPEPTWDYVDTWLKAARRHGIDVYATMMTLCFGNTNQRRGVVYEDPRWKIIDYFLEQKAQGKIRHFGISSHALPENLEKFLDRHGEHIEFCQIQLNYLDWTLQNAKRKYEILTERGIPVWVMEGLHGGRLCKLTDEEQAQLKALRPEESVTGWAFRWLQRLPNVAMILSGMSSLQQMKENIATFETSEPLTDAEDKVLSDIAEGMKNALPCTSCRYCCAGCPMELDIPLLINAFNDAKLHPKSFTVPMMLDTLPKEKLPSACIGCGQCAMVCPQKIDIPQAMSDFSALIPSLPNWTKLCEERAAAAKAARMNA